MAQEGIGVARRSQHDQGESPAASGPPVTLSGAVRRRRPVVLVCSLVLALVTAACGNGGQEDAEEAETADGATAEGTAGGGQTSELEGTLTVWDWQGECWGDTLAELNQQFTEQHPALEIERVIQPFDEYGQLVQAANAGRSGPDVLMMLPGGTHALNFAPALMPLGDRIDDEMRENILGWDAVSVNFEPDEGIVAVPIGVQGMVYWYNEQLFEEAGLPPEEPPSSYAELVDYAAQLDEAGITPFGGGNTNGEVDQWMFSLVWPAVGTPEDSLALGRGEILFTDPKVEQAAQMYLDLVEAGYFPDGLQSTPLSPDALESFKAGEQAMSPGLAAEFYSYPDFNEAFGEENAGVFPPVPLEGSELNYYPAGTAVAWGIPRYSTNPDAAWEYIRFLTMNEENVLKQFSDCGVLPNNLAVDVGEDVAPQVPMMRGWFEDNPTQLPVHQLWPAAVLNEYVRQMQLVVSGETSLDDALQSIAEVQEQQRSSG